MSRRSIRFIAGSADRIEISHTDLGGQWPPYHLQRMAGQRYKRAAKPRTENDTEVWEFYPEGWSTNDIRNHEN